jgi:hypothetical protein
MTSLAGLRPNSALFKQCDEYAKDVLGSGKYSPWLRAYSLLSGTFHEGWIPNNYYGEIVVPRIKGPYGEISHYRAISNRLFYTDLLPDLAYSVNGLLCTSSMEVIHPSELKKCLFATSDRVVFKIDDGRKGKGVSIYDTDSFPEESGAFGNGVFQRYIVQHPFFDQFSGRATSTIRITTVVDDDSNVSCRAVYLRLPRHSDTHVKAASAITVAVRLNGGLHEQGYRPNWVPIACHPDSKVAFAGLVIPHFQRCVHTCISLHDRMRFARVIGWDVIFDEPGNVVIMEWNGQHNGIKFSEAASGPCFADLGWQNLWKTDPSCGAPGPQSLSARSSARHRRVGLESH